MASYPGLFGGINMVVRKTEQQVLEIFDLPSRRRGKYGKGVKQLKRKLSEVICGLRPLLKVYCKTLQTEFCFVNEGLVDLAHTKLSGNVITMQMLAELMTDEQPFLPKIKQQFEKK